MKQDDQHVFQTVQNLQQLRCKLLRQHRLNKIVVATIVFVQDFHLTLMNYSLQFTMSICCL